MRIALLCTLIAPIAFISITGHAMAQTVREVNADDVRLARAMASDAGDTLALMKLCAPENKEAEVIARDAAEVILGMIGDAGKPLVNEMLARAEMPLLAADCDGFPEHWTESAEAMSTTGITLMDRLEGRDRAVAPK